MEMDEQIINDCDICGGLDLKLQPYSFDFAGQVKELHVCKVCFDKYVPMEDREKSRLGMSVGKVVWHELKILPEHFKWVCHENPKLRKTAEIRFNDRNYEIGHYIKLLEWEPEKGYSGSEAHIRVTHILDDREYLVEGYVSLSIMFIWSNV